MTFVSAFLVLVCLAPKAALAAHLPRAHPNNEPIATHIPAQAALLLLPLLLLLLLPCLNPHQAIAGCAGICTHKLWLRGGQGQPRFPLLLPLPLPLCLPQPLLPPLCQHFNRCLDPLPLRQKARARSWLKTAPNVRGTQG